MKSIIQDKKECYFTGSTQNLQRHHCIYGRGLRKLSDKYGLTVWLTAQAHHELHFSPPNAEIVKSNVQRLQLKQMAQKKAMKKYGWSVDDFISKFGKSYIKE